jgi:malate/lactate dehydrogenase
LFITTQIIVNHAISQKIDPSERNTINGFQVVKDDAWLKDVFVPTVQKRGAAVLNARKAR